MIPQCAICELQLEDQGHFLQDRNRSRPSGGIEDPLAYFHFCLRCWLLGDGLIQRWHMGDPRSDEHAALLTQWRERHQAQPPSESEAHETARGATE